MTELVTRTREEDRDKIVQWLSVTDFASNHHAARKKHTKATGTWITSLADFERWKNAPNSLIWLHGIPGCGKTILSSTVIEHLKMLSKTKPDVAVAYFYFNFDQSAKQNAINMLSCIAAQLCLKMVIIPGSLKAFYEQYRSGQDRANIRDLTNVLKDLSVSSELQDIFIVLDALDECPKFEARAELLELLLTIKGWAASKVHILVTSRKEPDIEDTLLPIVGTPPIPIQGLNVASDIELYIKAQLATRFNRLSADLKAEIEDTLVKGADGMSVLSLPTPNLD